MKLLPEIAAYFDAHLNADKGSLDVIFTPDAIVRDEGAEYVGLAEILAWRLATSTKYADLASEPVAQSVDGDRIVVKSKVNGDFPTSPVMLDYTFTLVRGRIATLEIH
ncbi:nuclear transport factor 2 family protein [Kaistia terrae]|uniref:Nuclear transport factor 2 family protein n=1 Tax=Kaistia terrae TaxID=537017 RepID=A0ABW0PR47_9HYPH|nr:nuclear transport factor 2 family protein [Kaistia terrae]MCX5577737.1 nuclear transport factor 2 family protein [Kaistia terrae]